MISIGCLLFCYLQTPLSLYESYFLANLEKHQIQLNAEAISPLQLIMQATYFHLLFQIAHFSQHLNFSLMTTSSFVDY